MGRPTKTGENFQLKNRLTQSMNALHLLIRKAKVGDLQNPKNDKNAHVASAMVNYLTINDG